MFVCVSVFTAATLIGKPGYRQSRSLVGIVLISVGSQCALYFGRRASPTTLWANEIFTGTAASRSAASVMDRPRGNTVYVDGIITRRWGGGRARTPRFRIRRRRRHREDFQRSHGIQSQRSVPKSHAGRWSRVIVSARGSASVKCRTCRGISGLSNVRGELISGHLPPTSTDPASRGPYFLYHMDPPNASCLLVGVRKEFSVLCADCKFVRYRLLDTFLSRASLDNKYH